MTLSTAHLTTNRYTRSQIPMERVVGLSFHWPEAPGWSAEKLRNYLDTLPHTEPGRFASYHYLVGKEGEVINIVPDDECAWQSGPRQDTLPEARELLGGAPNWRTIGICMCHPDDSGAYLRKTWQSAVQIAAQRMVEHNLPTDAPLLRHYDCTRKRCPEWFVANPQDWLEFCHDVRAEASAIRRAA
jgi:N-acetylmuramoyl-L-alanine amidase